VTLPRPSKFCDEPKKFTGIEGESRSFSVAIESTAETFHRGGTPFYRIIHSDGQHRLSTKEGIQYEKHFGQRSSLG
jgi:hypothetical protein